MTKKNALITISHYLSRPKKPLFELVSSLKNKNFDLLIVVNSDEIFGSNFVELNNGVKCIVRANTGMNIGGWDCAYRLNPSYDYYIFLQDECVLNSHEVSSKYLDKLQDKNIGMIGDSINTKWSLPWDEIRKLRLNYMVDKDKMGVAISRVDYYYSKMMDWGISPGLSGRHLRALSWAFSGETLHKINGFPIGYSKEECIAAEIAVSKSVEQIGLRVEQAHCDPFHFFYHREWRLDGMGKI